MKQWPTTYTKNIIRACQGNAKPALIRMLVRTVAFANHQSVGRHTASWPSDHTAASLHFSLFPISFFFKIIQEPNKKRTLFPSSNLYRYLKTLCFRILHFCLKDKYACQWYRNSLTEYHPHKIFTCTGVVLHLKFYRVSNHLRLSEKVSFSFCDKSFPDKN